MSEKKKHLVQLWINEDKYQEVKLAADSVEEPVTTWIRRAIFAALRRWEKPSVAKSAYPKCSVCGKHHNEQDHFNQGESNG